MAKKATYEELIFQLGDLAREHMSESNLLKKMDLVFELEDDVVAQREAFEALEDDINAEAEAYQSFLDQQAQEKQEQEDIKTKWRSAVIGVEGRSRELRKKLSSQKAAWRYQKFGLKRTEDKHKEMELREGHDVRKITISRENLKKLRLQVMRMMRDIEEMEYEFKQVLTPRPGQQGAQGILAHKRLLEMEDEAEERLEVHEQKMKDLDEAAALQEEQVKLAEEELDAATYELGVEAYEVRIPHDALNDTYLALDTAK